MENRQRQLFDDAVRSRAYLETMHALIPMTYASPIRETLDRIIEVILRAAMRQTAGAETAQETVREKARLRDALIHQHLAPAVAAARLALGDEPLYGGVTMPSASLADQQLIARARWMGGTLACHAPRLIAVGLRPAFLEELDTAASAVEQAMGAARMAMADRTTATFGLKPSGTRRRSSPCCASSTG